MAFAREKEDGKPDKRNIIRGHRISSNLFSGLGTRGCTENSIRANQVYYQLYRMNYAMIRRLTHGVLRMLRLCSCSDQVRSPSTQALLRYTLLRLRLKQQLLTSRD